MPIRPLESELFHADGRTDMTKLVVTCRNFANAPKKLGREGRTVKVHDNEFGKKKQANNGGGIQRNSGKNY